MSQELLLKTPKVDIYSYSKASFLLFFKSFPSNLLREELKGIYAKWNENLTLNGEKIKGWIVAKKHKEELENILSKYESESSTSKKDFISKKDLINNDSISHKSNVLFSSKSDIEDLINSLNIIKLDCSGDSLNENEILSEKEILILGKLLLNNYNLFEWKVKVDDDTASYGRCIRSKKIITISSYYNTGDRKNHILNTLLHQISHALTPGEDHSAIWRKVATAIGYEGKICSRYRDDGKYIYSLSCECGINEINVFALSSYFISSYICSQCKSALTELLNE